MRHKIFTEFSKVCCSVMLQKILIIVWHATCFSVAQCTVWQHYNYFCKLRKEFFFNNVPARPVGLHEYENGHFYSCALFFKNKHVYFHKFPSASRYLLPLFHYLRLLLSTTLYSIIIYFPLKSSPKCDSLEHGLCLEDSNSSLEFPSLKDWNCFPFPYLWKWQTINHPLDILRDQLHGVLYFISRNQ